MLLGGLLLVGGQAALLRARSEFPVLSGFSPSFRLLPKCLLNQLLGGTDGQKSR